MLQTRCDELQSQLTDVKRKNWEQKFSSSNPQQTAPNTGIGMTRSISHGDALKSANKKTYPEDSDEDGENNPETSILREKINVLQRQVADERKQRELLQDQVVNVVADNTSLWQQLDHVTKEAATWREKLEMLTTKYADEISAFNEQREKIGVVINGNCDDDETATATMVPPVLRLESDSSVSSHGVQLSILDEIADSLRDRFLDDFKREQESEQEKQLEISESKDSKIKSKTTQTDTGLIIDYLASQGADPTHGRFQRGPPEYKKLFKEIFDIIKKAQEEDAARVNQPQRQRHQKQKKQIVYYYNQF